MVEEGILKVFGELGITCKVNKNDKIIYVPEFDGTIILGSSENPYTLEGQVYDAAWMDEGGLMGLATWKVVERRLGFKQGQILITTIPYTDGWIKKLWDDSKVEGSPIDWIPITTPENPLYPREQIEYFRRNNSPEWCKRFLDGDFSREVGLIFPEPEDSELFIDLEDEFEWNTDCKHCAGDCHGGIPCWWPCYSGHDYGYNAPTTGMWGRWDPDNDVLYLIAEYEGKKQTITNHLAEWESEGLAGPGAIDMAFGDPANPEVWERCREEGYPIVSGNNDILASIDLINYRLRNGKLKVSKDLELWRDHRRTYRWAPIEKNGEVFLDKPLKPQPAEHLMDALRYLVMGVQEFAPVPVDLPSVVSNRHHLSGK